MTPEQLKAELLGGDTSTHWLQEGQNYAYNVSTDPLCADDWTTADVAQAFEAGARLAERDATAATAALRAELDALRRESQGWQSNFAALQQALVGDTGLSGITVAAALRRDAERHRKFRSMVRGHRPLGSGRPATFAYPSAMELPAVTGDIMRGSVAQHFDAAIDAAMKETP